MSAHLVEDSVRLNNLLSSDLTYLPYYWPDDDLKQLQALEKPVRSKAETQRASIDTTYVKLQQFIALHPDLFPDPALYTREMWEWAVLIFFTRSFAYTVPDTSCLMPWNDLFNHADRWTAVCKLVPYS